MLLPKDFHVDDLLLNGEPLPDSLRAGIVRRIAENAAHTLPPYYDKLPANVQAGYRVIHEARQDPRSAVSEATMDYVVEGLTTGTLPDDYSWSVSVFSLDDVRIDGQPLSETMRSQVLERHAGRGGSLSDAMAYFVSLEFERRICTGELVDDYSFYTFADK